MKTALVCDWLTGMRGGERCLETVCKLYPDADIFTLVHFPGCVSQTIESHRIYTSYIQHLPCNAHTFRRYLPLFPNAIERFDLSNYDCVISFSHCAAKGVRVPKGIPNICYCHTPMRYAWFMRDEYLSSYRGFKRWAADKLLDCLRDWDKKTSDRVTHFIANSRNVQNRIKLSYGRDSVVIYPPVDCNRFSLSTDDGGFYLVVSALVPYKRVDIAVKAFSSLDRKLLVVGNGPELKHLKAIASSNIAFIENAGDIEVAEYMKKCTALVFPGEEDFGIVPLEAQASGKLVVAFGKGGALETVIGLNENMSQVGNATGIFFYQQTPRALMDVILLFEKIKGKFDAQKCRSNAIRFDNILYQQSMQKYIHNVIGEYQS
jgi:glycosyltransferase involved in cell wall biosynthesis